MNQRRLMSKLIHSLIVLTLTGGLVALIDRMPASGPEPRHGPIGRQDMADVQRAERIRGSTIRWTWEEGPTAGMTHEHVFHEDGTVTWRVVEGPRAGHSATEEEYAALRVAEDVYAVSYRAASGYTLTVVLDFQDGEMVGFASGAEEWYPLKGRFEVVE